MSSVATTTPAPPSSPTVDPSMSDTVTPRSFAVIALEVFAFATLAGVYLVFRASYPEFTRAAMTCTHWAWGAAQLLLIVIATIALLAFVKQMGGSRSSLMALAAVAIMCGLAAAALKAMEWASFGGPRVIVVDTPAARASARPAAPKPAAHATADPKLGQKAYVATCAACHGASAEGVPQVAPSLKDSESLKKATDAQVAAVIANGRAANDPASKTSKAMPARGGNPFLSDSDIAAIVAWLRQVSEGAAATAGAASSAAPAAPGWIVPRPPQPPVGLASHMMHNTTPPPLPAQYQEQVPNDQQKTFAPMAAALGVFQGVHLLIGIGLCCVLLWRSHSDEPEARLARFARFHWFATVVIWVALFPLLYIV